MRPALGIAVLCFAGCEPPPPPVISIHVTPEDAQVAIGSNAASGALEAVVEPGELEVRATRRGFESRTERWVLEAGTERHEVWELVPQKIPVTAVTQPAGATVLVDGSAAGTTPWSGTHDAGPLRLDLVLEGWKTESVDMFLDEPLALDEWLDPQGQIVELDRIVLTTHLPKGLRITPDNSEIWVASLGGRGFVVHGLPSGELIAEVELIGDGGSVEVVFDKDARKAYLTQMETARVFEVDMETKEVLRMFETGSIFTKVPVLSADGASLYASNWLGNEITRIDLASGSVRNFATISTPRGLYATPDGQSLYVASFGGGGLGRIDLSTMRTERLAAGRALRHMVASPDGRRLYVSDMSKGTVHTYNIDESTWEVLARVNENPNTIDLTPDGKMLFVSNRGRNGRGGYLTVGEQRGSVLVVDTSNGEILDAIAGGMQCTALDVSDDGSLLVFSDFRDDTLRIYNIPSYSAFANADGGRLRHHEEDLMDLSYPHPERPIEEVVGASGG